MSSRARRTRSFSLPSVLASWSSIRWSMRACMSAALPNVMASSTSRRSWRATTGSRPRVAFARMICNDLSMIVRKCVLRVEPEACERLPHGLQEGRLPDRVVGVLREASHLRVLLLLEGLGPLGQDRIRAAHVGPLPFLPGRLPVRGAQGDLRGRVGARLAEAVPGLLGEERDVCVHALPEGVLRLCEELPRLRDVDPVPPGRVDVGARPVEDRLGPGILALESAFSIAL